MVNYIWGLVFVVLLLLGGLATIAIGQSSPALAFLFAHRLALPRRGRSRRRSGWPPSGRRPSSFASASSTRIKGPGLFCIIPLDRPDPDGRHPRADGEHPQAAGDHARQRAGDDRRRALLPGRQRRRRDHHGAGLSLRDHAVLPDLAPRRHRPDDARPALDRARGDRQVDRAARREGHQGLGPGGHGLCGSRTSTCPRS